LVVDATKTGQAAMASGHAGGMAPAASPPRSHPQGSQVAGSDDPADAGGSAGNQPSRSVTRPDREDGKAGKHRDRGRDRVDNHRTAKPDKAKPGKAKKK
jgi:hypothetical protein